MPPRGPTGQRMACASSCAWTTRRTVCPKADARASPSPLRGAGRGEGKWPERVAAPASNAQSTLAALAPRYACRPLPGGRGDKRLLDFPVQRPETAMSQPEVVIVGSFVQDHAWLTDRFPQTGETRRALGFNTGPGGKGFNQAVACARQGVASLFIGAIGDDHLGTIAQRFGEDEGLPCRWQVRDDVATAASSIVV